LDFANELGLDGLTLLLELALDRFFAQKTLPSLELTEQSTWRSFAFRQDLLAKLLADFFLHRLEDLLVLLVSAMPGACLVLIGVEGVDAAEGIESRVHLEALLFFRSQ